MGMKTIRSSAVISMCGKYRYRLERDLRPGWGDGTRTMTWIMVNPSTADASTDDATIRKVCGFAERHGCDRVIVGNLFAWRTPNVRDLALVADPCGPENDRHLEEMIRESDLLVCAWGTANKLPVTLRQRYTIIRDIAQTHGVTTRCFGIARDGHPRHPLMLSYATPIEFWRPPG